MNKRIKKKIHNRYGFKNYSFKDPAKRLRLFIKIQERKGPLIPRHIKDRTVELLSQNERPMF